MVKFIGRDSGPKGVQLLNINMPSSTLQEINRVHDGNLHDIRNHKHSES